MDEREFKARTKRLGLLIIHLVEELPRSVAGTVIGRQLIRCGTAIGSNYRAACRAKSTPDMLAKLAIVEEEADETLYWLEMIVEAGLLPSERVTQVASETNEILAMTVASMKTVRLQQARNPKSKIQNPKSNGRSLHA